MKKISFLSFLFIASLAFSQKVEELKETALRDANIAATATLKENYSLLLKHTFPEVVKVMGGKENAVEIIKSTMETMKEQGFVFENAEVIEVSEIVKEQEQYRCYVENKNTMTINNMRIYSRSFLLGAYDENLKIWYFIEAEKIKNKAMMDKILPNFKTSLKIPADETKTEKIE